MCEELKLKKLESETWGFRLTGGRDFGTPLTVLRVTGASVAEESGMEVGDMIVSINGECTQSMTHVEAQQHIIGAGNSLILQILRGSPVPAPELTSGGTPFRGMTPNITVQRCESEMTNESHDGVKPENTIPQLQHPQQSETPPTEEELSEQLIAEKMLENAELLEGNVIGVNFKRFIPKVDFIKNSLVYQVLQEEQVYTARTEEEQLEKCPEKRFSTFLVHPNNLKPKVKKEAAKLPKRPKTPIEPDVEKQEEKQSENKPKPENEPKATDNKPAEQTVAENDTSEESKKTEQKEQVVEMKEQNTVEIKINDEPLKEEEKTEKELPEAIANDTQEHGDSETPGVNAEGEPDPLTKQEILNAQVELPSITEENEEVTEDSEFNKQLTLIKTQLESLRQLPSLIETQLNLFQVQINALVDLKVKDIKKSKEDKSEAKDSPEAQETGGEAKDEPRPTENEAGFELEKQFEEYGVAGETEGSGEQHGQRQDESEAQQEVHGQEHGDVTRESHVAEKPKSKRSSLFNGITPQPRPVVLPGGRIWRKPQDAYNDEFIAETLITQAEVLIGTNTGVNFRKYEPPKFAMSESAVWKLINNIENNSTEVDEAIDYYQTPIDEKKIFVAGLHMNPDVEAVVREVEAEEALKNAPPVNNHHCEVIIAQEAA